MSDPSITPSSDAGAQIAPSSTPASTPTPSEIEVREDSVLKFGDQKVPFSKYRGIESEYTKATQERSKLQSQVQELQRQIQQAQQAQRQSQQPQRNPAADAIAKIRALPYLSGEEAAGVVEQLLGGFQQRDAIAYMLAQRLAQLEQSMSGVRDQHVNQTFAQKINKFRTDLQIPERFQKRLEELYLAYEGDDLDQEFPRIAKEWYDDIQAGFEELRKAKIESARKIPFVPGRGGQASPSKPLDFTGAESVTEQADKAWNAFGLGEKADRT